VTMVAERWNLVCFIVVTSSSKARLQLRDQERRQLDVGILEARAHSGLMTTRQRLVVNSIVWIHAAGTPRARGRYGAISGRAASHGVRTCAL
jgi:hypothetical protein